MAKDANIALRVPSDLADRLAECAEKLDLSKNDIARHAIRAAVAAIEANGFKIELPLEMAVKKGGTSENKNDREDAPAQVERAGKKATERTRMQNIPRSSSIHSRAGNLPPDLIPPTEPRTITEKGATK